MERDREFGNDPREGLVVSLGVLSTFSCRSRALSAWEGECLSTIFHEMQTGLVPKPFSAPFAPH